MKRTYDNQSSNNQNKKMKLKNADEEDLAKFAEWKKEAGLEIDNYDEARNGPISSRCLEKVLFVLFKNEYNRPENWNDPTKFNHITLVDGDGGEFTNFNYVRCDQLNGAQFDHLMTLSMYNNGDDGLPSRVDMWFAKDREDIGSETIDPSTGLNDYGYSHLSEIAMFNEDKYSEDGKVLVLRERLHKPFVSECANHVGFAHSFYVSGF